MMVFSSQPYKNLGTKLLVLRRERHLTQQDIAHVAGVHAQTVARWEKGLSAPDVIQAKALHDSYGWDLQA